MKRDIWIQLAFLFILIFEANMCLSTASKITNNKMYRKDIIDYVSMYIGTKNLVTERLILRQITPNDAEDMFKFSSNPEIETWDSIDVTIKDTYNFIQLLQQKYKANEPTLWGIAIKETNKLIGYCGFSSLQVDHSIVELEYALDKPYWNKGLMSEAVEAILSFAFNVLKINRIIAFTILSNERSEKVLLKAGMKFEGLHREAGYSNGAFWDMKSYALTRNDYLNNTINY